MILFKVINAHNYEAFELRPATRGEHYDVETWAYATGQKIRWNILESVVEPGPAAKQGDLVGSVGGEIVDVFRRIGVSLNAHADGKVIRLDSGEIRYRADTEWERKALMASKFKLDTDNTYVRNDEGAEYSARTILQGGV